MTKRFAVEQPARAVACCGPRPKLRPVDTKPYAALFKALGDETRLEILGLLASARGELCVCEIETQVKELSQPTISHHLQKLREAGLVTAERRGTWVFYALDRSSMGQLKDFVTLLGG